MLRNINRFVVVIALGVAQAGCSWITTFVVANESEAPVQVDYQISNEGKNMPYCPDDKFILRPRVVPVAQVETIDESTTIIQYSCNSDRRMVRLTLGPGQAVSIFRSGTYTGTSRGNENVMQLSVEGAKGSITYTGNQLTRGFVKKKETLYILTYR